MDKVEEAQAYYLTPLLILEVSETSWHDEQHMPLIEFLSQQATGLENTGSHATEKRLIYYIYCT